MVTITLWFKSKCKVQLLISVNGQSMSNWTKKMKVTISDFDETWYNRCPIWEYEMTQV